MGAYLDSGERCDCEDEKEDDAIESLWQILSKKKTACSGIQDSQIGN